MREPESVDAERTVQFQSEVERFSPVRVFRGYAFWPEAPGREESNTRHSIPWPWFESGIAKASRRVFLMIFFGT